MKTIKLPYVLAREIRIYEKTDIAVPKLLFENKGNGQVEVKVLNKGYTDYADMKFVVIK